MRKTYFGLLFVLLFLSSCATGSYVIHTDNLNMNQTQVVLQENNFRVVKTVKSLYIYKQDEFWQTFKKKQMYESAYSKFLEEANLTGAQTIINVTIEETNRSTKSSEQKGIMITGVVIEFTGSEQSGK